MTFGFEFAISSSLIFLQEVSTDFQDLGKLLLGGVALAIVIAIAFTFVRFRLRDKKPQRSSFISISAQPDDE
jgi:uncharacterized membrane protein